jgi:hypothetical protein
MWNVGHDDKKRAFDSAARERSEMADAVQMPDAKISVVAAAAGCSRRVAR